MTGIGATSGTEGECSEVGSSDVTFDITGRPPELSLILEGCEHINALLLDVTGVEITKQALN